MGSTEAQTSAKREAPEPESGLGPSQQLPTRPRPTGPGPDSRVVKMLLTVVILFTVSWLPYHAYFIYLFHHPGAAYADCIQHVYLAMYWLAMAHTTYNPIVYYCMNQRSVLHERK
ncbi:hypothetical protein HPB52_020299 [Rhipicephalus sanguineus]|uniref:G-protein coupled receptors family 1 profile domain-containing protein n=1 Tax=Rhipicephalus sanguineus TaxID=34632 RepID=A0A9D4TBK7_RHISA|nr:hypothetical protein HPB52_020299 [Rhipicephalus sanguineus]